MAKAKKTTEMSPGLAAFAAISAVAIGAVAGANAAQAIEATSNVAPDTTDATEAAKNTGGVPVGYVEPTGTGTVRMNPPITDEQALASGRKKAEADEAAKKAAKEAKAKEKADKAAVKDAEKAQKAEARAKAKEERQARLAELASEGKTYTGSMLALADKVKQGVYVKGTNGQLRSTDELAIALDGIAATDVVRIGLDLLKLEDNPYSVLNIGQQSMNLRNKMRGAIKKDVFKITDIADYVARNKIHVVTAESVAKVKAEKDAKAAAAKAEKDAKAATAIKANTNTEAMKEVTKPSPPVEEVETTTA